MSGDPRRRRAEPLLAAEVGRGVTGTSRRDGNDTVSKRIEQHEDQLSDPPLGMTVQACYDPASRRPGDETMKYHRRARQNLADWRAAFRDDPFCG